MPVMNIVRVRVCVNQGRVTVPVGVRSLRELFLGMFMLMVLIMHMLVSVFERMVLVRVLVPVGHQQKDPRCHRG